MLAQIKYPTSKAETQPRSSVLLVINHPAQKLEYRHPFYLHAVMFCWGLNRTKCTKLVSQKFSQWLPLYFGPRMLKHPIMFGYSFVCQGLPFNMKANWSSFVVYILVSLWAIRKGEENGALRITTFDPCTYPGSRAMPQRSDLRKRY